MDDMGHALTVRSDATGVIRWCLSVWPSNRRDGEDSSQGELTIQAIAELILEDPRQASFQFE